MSTRILDDDFDILQLTTYQACILQASTNRGLQRNCDIVLKKYDLTKTRWLIIGTILESGDAGIRLTDISSRVDTTIPYVTTTINFLEARGIVVRVENSADSRSKLITISESFMVTCHEIEANLREVLRAEIYSHISPDDLRVYMKVLARFALLELDRK